MVPRVRAWLKRRLLGFPIVRRYAEEKQSLLASWYETSAARGALTSQLSALRERLAQSRKEGQIREGQMAVLAAELKHLSAEAERLDTELEKVSLSVADLKAERDALSQRQAPRRLLEGTERHLSE